MASFVSTLSRAIRADVQGIALAAIRDAAEGFALNGSWKVHVQAVADDAATLKPRAGTLAHMVGAVMGGMLHDPLRPTLQGLKIDRTEKAARAAAYGDIVMARVHEMLAASEAVKAATKEKAKATREAKQAPAPVAPVAEDQKPLADTARHDRVLSYVDAMSDDALSMLAEALMTSPRMGKALAAAYAIQSAKQKAPKQKKAAPVAQAA